MKLLDCLSGKAIWGQTALSAVVKNYPFYKDYWKAKQINSDT